MQPTSNAIERRFQCGSPEVSRSGKNPKRAGVSSPRTAALRRRLLSASLPTGHWSGGPVKAQTKEAVASTSADSFEEFVLTLQDRIVRQVQALDGMPDKGFRKDRWERGPGAGFGLTRVLEGGALLEKAAVNVSVVRGVLSPQRAAAMSSRGRSGVDPAGGQEYAAESLSLVFHPRHPMVPTLRADVRKFGVGTACWFGGGCDLTPAYLFADDAKEFHAFWAGVCAASGRGLYGEFKEWCDRYFFLPARGEHRGVGGIFFDDLVPGEQEYDVEAFVRSVGTGILESWTPIAERRRSMAFSEEQRRWQLLRRGRYVEFNLLYDRGVRFGLDGGRIESVMVSAPPLVAWDYDVRPADGTPEARLLEVLRQPKEWLNHVDG